MVAGTKYVRAQFSPSYMSFQDLYRQIVRQQNFPSNLNVFFYSSYSIFYLFQSIQSFKEWIDIF